jgi:hypothetical protein
MNESCPSRGLVDRHFRGTIAPRREIQLRAHLGSCESCHWRYERYLVLAQLDRSIASAEDRLACALGLAPRRRARFRSVAVAVGLAAVLVALGLWPMAQPAYVARGSGAMDRDQVLYVYRITPGGTPQAVVNGLIGDRDELAFAYLNRAGWSRLLVYAVDETGQIYWYHPAWTNAATDPVAVQIEAGPERHELPEAIAQPLPHGRLEIHAVFTDDAVSVRAIERKKRPGRMQELVIPIQVIEQERP